MRTTADHPGHRCVTPNPPRTVCHVDGHVTTARRSARSATVFTVVVIAAALPLVGLISLLLREQLDPHFENYRAHFVIFGFVGAVAFALGFAAGEAANRRGDARVLLLSLAFVATGGFMGIHALGTTGILFTDDHAGFKVAIPVGLFVSAVFAAGSAFVDVRPGIAPWVIRYRPLLHGGVLVSMGVWFLWTVAKLPPLGGASSEAARGHLLTALAIVGTAIYAASAARYWFVFRHGRQLLPAAVIACFLLLSEAMIGVAVTGERKWHASWWEWHGLIVTAYLVIGLAVRHEWRDERFRHLYLSTTRERRQDISVLFGDLVGFTAFADRSTPAEVAELLNAYWGLAAPLITREFGGEIEKFIGDGVMATFNGRGDPGSRLSRLVRGADSPGTAGGSRRRAARLAADAHRRQQRRSGRAGGRRPRARRLPARRRHCQHRRTTRDPRAGRWDSDRGRHVWAAA